MALCWIEHVVGDLHQPLHTTALFSRTNFSGGDRGGNGIELPDRTSLHSHWDAMGGSIRSMTGLKRRVERLMNDQSLGRAAEGAKGELSARKWAEEGRVICQKTVYDESVLQTVRAAERGKPRRSVRVEELSDEYMQTARRIADERIMIAGYRLAELLKMAFSAK